MLSAARSLFLTRGFAATAMTDVADHAGVAVPTVYTTVGGKAALLQRVMDVAIAGDDAPIPILDRPDILAVLAEPDGRRKLARYARHLRLVHERSAELDQVIRAAADADPEIRSCCVPLTRNVFTACGCSPSTSPPHDHYVAG